MWSGAGNSGSAELLAFPFPVGLGVMKDTRSEHLRETNVLTGMSICCDNLGDNDVTTDPISYERISVTFCAGPLGIKLGETTKGAIIVQGFHSTVCNNSNLAFYIL
jgi:hypothetical protein